MSIDLVFGSDNGKGAFRLSMNINETFTSGRNINIIFRVAHLH